MIFLLKLRTNLTLLLITLCFPIGVLLSSCGQSNPSVNTSDNPTPETPTVEANPPVQTPSPNQTNNEQEELMFSITNNNPQTISKLLVSNNGNNWENFDLGGQTIKSKEKVVLLWTKNAKESGCDWKIKATFANQKDSEPLILNICQQPDLIFP